MNLPQVKTIATHNGFFHGDDVFAVAVLKLIYPEAKIIRTRDEKEIEKADLRVDVGDKYNPQTLDFDHHQLDFNLKHKSNILYASAGLIWLNFHDFFSDNKDVYEELDLLFENIDAHDNGIQTYEKKIQAVYDISIIISNFMPLFPDNSTENIDKSFFSGVELAQKIFKNELSRAKNLSINYKKVREAIKKNTHKGFIVFDKRYESEKVLSTETKLLFKVSPSLEGNAFSVYSIPKKYGSFGARRLLPESWADLKGEELDKVTGVKGCLFCHKHRFMAKTKSLDSAIKLAQIAVQS